MRPGYAIDIQWYTTHVLSTRRYNDAENDCFLILEPHVFMTRQMNALVRRDFSIRDEVQSFCWQCPQSLRSHPLAIVREVGKTQDRRLSPRSLIPKNSRIVCPEPNQPTSSKFRGSLSHLDHPLKSSKDLSRRGVNVLPLFKPGQIKLRPVDPSRIVPLVRFGHVRIIIECAQFVAEVKQRDASGGHDDRVH